MVEMGKLYYETPCSDCGASGVYGKHHVKDQPALICSGPGGLRTEVTIDYEGVRHALEVLEHGRQTHVEWIDYLENENPDFDTEHVGDADHHRWYLTGYEPAIAFMAALVEGSNQ